MDKKITKRPMNPSELQKLAGLYPLQKRKLILKDPNTLSIGSRLRRERYLRKMTIDQMASYLDISSSYLGAVERGNRPISRKLMNLLHERLDLSYDFMLEGLSISGSTISQYVRESSLYATTHHNLNVLLGVCTDDELESCYQLIHTYLKYVRDTKDKPDKPAD